MLIDRASSAVKSAVDKLKSLVLKASGRDDEQLCQQLADPETSRDELVALLTEVEAPSDEELVAAAKDVLRLTGHLDQRGIYIADMHHNCGVQVGDGNTMTLNFNG